ncbi:hypothetical protein BZA70DRAFT_271121 [Myxozyma melibiosi]|uniref:Uncharacterized protein n=1 Tax=Myxozyma melibiosi TaxID=54550 RepID=A0ABR1FC91_9ASCO
MSFLCTSRLLRRQVGLKPSSRLHSPTIRISPSTGSVRFAMSEINPSNPEEEEVSTKIKTGLYAPILYSVDYINPYEKSVARQPIYTAPSSFHVAATKRTMWTFAVIGGYFSTAMMAMDGIPLSLSLLVGIPSVLPLPITYWLTAPYVNRIFRIYDQPEGEPVDVEKLKENEEFIFECIGVFGRGLYNTRVKLSDLRVVNKRFGWVTLEVTDESAKKIKPKRNFLLDAFDGLRTRRWFYVADDVGGYKMERIWAIIDRQSGVDNGRD